MSRKRNRNRNSMIFFSFFKNFSFNNQILKYLRPAEGLEPPTYCLQGSRTTNCAMQAYLIGREGVEPSVSYSLTAYKAATLTAELPPIT